MPKVRCEPRAVSGTSGSTARLGGKTNWSQVVRRQPGIFCDSGKHARADFFTIMEGEHEIRPVRPGKGFMRTRLALERPANSIEG